MSSRITQSPKFWMFVPVGLLLMSVGMWGTATWIAVSDDSSYAVEEDYYQKSLLWDEQKEQESHNLELGWKLVQTLERPEPGESATRVLVSLFDKENQALAGASIQLQAFHVAHSGFPQTISFEAQAKPGLYAGELQLRPLGQWEWRWVVTLGDKRFTLKRRTLVR